MLTIINDGQAISATNYWDLPQAAEGYFYASWNAGALRLLVPDGMLSHVAEMRTGTLAVVTRGNLQGRKDSLEVMFDDGSDSPYALHIVREQVDILLDDAAAGSSIAVSAWGQQGLIASWPGRYRVAAHLPCLDAWTGQ